MTGETLNIPPLLFLLCAAFGSAVLVTLIRWLPNPEAGARPLAPMIGAALFRTFILGAGLSLLRQIFIAQDQTWPEISIIALAFGLFTLKTNGHDLLRKLWREIGSIALLAALIALLWTLILTVFFSALTLFKALYAAMPLIFAAQHPEIPAIIVCGLLLFAVLALLFKRNPAARGDRKTVQKIIMALLLALALFILPLMAKEIAGSEKLEKLMNARPALQRI